MNACLGGGVLVEPTVQLDSPASVAGNPVGAGGPAARREQAVNLGEPGGEVLVVAAQAEQPELGHQVEGGRGQVGWQRTIQAVGADPCDQ